MTFCRHRNWMAFLRSEFVCEHFYLISGKTISCRHRICMGKIIQMRCLQEMVVGIRLCLILSFFGLNVLPYSLHLNGIPSKWIRSWRLNSLSVVNEHSHFSQRNQFGQLWTAEVGQASLPYPCRQLFEPKWCSVASTRIYVYASIPPPEVWYTININSPTSRTSLVG